MESRSWRSRTPTPSRRSSKETIGVVGVGAMGTALLERLRLAHVEPVLYDIDPDALSCARDSAPPARLGAGGKVAG